MTVTRKLIKCTNQSEYECGKDALVSIFNAIILWSNVIRSLLPYWKEYPIPSRNFRRRKNTINIYEAEKYIDGNGDTWFDHEFCVMLFCQFVLVFYWILFCCNIFNHSF